jgi:hypothetical protein
MPDIAIFFYIYLFISGSIAVASHVVVIILSLRIKKNGHLLGAYSGLLYVLSSFIAVWVHLYSVYFEIINFNTIVTTIISLVTATSLLLFLLSLLKCIRVNIRKHDSTASE